MEQMSLISKKEGERIDKFLGEESRRSFPFLYSETFKGRSDPCQWEKGESKL